MKPQDYEKYQLGLIASEYERRGFIVQSEQMLPGSVFRFDAIARHRDSGKLVIIELVHSNLPFDRLEERKAALTRAAQSMPDALVDFRYIDTETSPYRMLRQRGQDQIPADVLTTSIKKRLPRADDDQLSATRQILDLWTMHITTLRAYASAVGLDAADADKVLDLYNSLLQRQRLIPPEVMEDGIESDLFQLNRVVMAALEGIVVQPQDVAQMRAHVVSVRMQVRKQLKNNGGVL